MIDDKTMTDYSYIVSNRFEAINSRYIKLMGEQIRDIGKLSPSNLHRLEQMAKMDANIDEINRLLAAECNKTVAELQQIYQISGMSAYGDASKYYMAKGVNQIPFAENKWMQNHIQSISELTGGTFKNMANTTVMRGNYRDMVDLAIDSVASGQEGYNAAIISHLRDTARTGMSVKYSSGITRRLDSAVRMNILEGVRQVNNGIRQQMGKEFGADGVEISAHALCAEDHIDIQGQQYALGDKDVTVNGVTYESFEQMNGSLDREISTLNCKHIIFPIVLGISEPTYTDEELDAFKLNSHETVDIGGKKMTKYEASQVLRKIETAMRYAKDDYIAAEALGGDAGQKAMDEASNKLYVLDKKYKDICKRAGLEEHLDRAYVPGFNGRQKAPKPVTIKANLKEFVPDEDNAIVNFTESRKQYDEKVQELLALDKEVDMAQDEYMDAMDTPKAAELELAFNEKFEKIESLREVIKDLKVALSGKEAKAVRQIEKNFADLTGIPIDKVNMTGLQYDTAEMIYNSYDTVLKKFPELKGGLAEFTYDGVYGDAYASCNILTGEIHAHGFFAKYDDMIEKYAYDVAKGFHPIGTDHSSIIIHELGHALDGYMTKNHLLGADYNQFGIISTASKTARDMVLKMLGFDKQEIAIELKNQGLTLSQRRDILEQREREFIAKHVSGYATGFDSDGSASTKHPEREFFAECFAEYMTSDNPREAAKIFGEIIETALGR